VRPFPPFSFFSRIASKDVVFSYEPANRQTTPDFLVAVTDPLARIPRVGLSNQPRTAGEFAEYFQKSPHGRLNKDEINDYLGQFVGKSDKKAAYMESARAEFAKGSGKAKFVFALFFCGLALAKKWFSFSARICLAYHNKLLS